MFTKNGVAKMLTLTERFPIFSVFMEGNVLFSYFRWVFGNHNYKCGWLEIILENVQSFFNVLQNLHFIALITTKCHWLTKRNLTITTAVSDWTAYHLTRTWAQKYSKWGHGEQLQMSLIVKEKPNDNHKLQLQPSVMELQYHLTRTWTQQCSF